MRVKTPIHRFSPEFNTWKNTPPLKKKKIKTTKLGIYLDFFGENKAVNKLSDIWAMEQEIVSLKLVEHTKKLRERYERPIKSSDIWEIKKPLKIIRREK